MVGGFLAGTGWLLVTGSFRVMLGEAPSVPKLVLGGLLLSLGLGFLVDWLWDGWTRLARADYAVTALIVGAVGFLEGIAVGIVAAAILFTVNYSRINVIKYTLSGAHHQSNVDRPFHHHRLLRERGEQIHILELQSYIFFGTAYKLLLKLRERTDDPTLAPMRYVILDFRQVTGLDSSASPAPFAAVSSFPASPASRRRQGRSIGTLRRYAA
ncbi:MAG: STAS domain-containing protein [Candidatus Binatia bacterium]